MTVLRGLLCTHSVSYTGECTRYVGNLISKSKTASGGPVAHLELSHLTDWPSRHGTRTWPFLRAMLGKWAQAGLPGIADDLIAFIDEPEHFEERGDWYLRWSPTTPSVEIHGAGAQEHPGWPEQVVRGGRSQP